MANQSISVQQEKPRTAPCTSLVFKKLELSDRNILNPILINDPQCISGFTFATLFAWNPIYRYEWVMCGGTLFISCAPTEAPERHFLQPVGSFDSAAQSAFFDMIEHLGYPVQILGVGEPFLRKNTVFVSLFEKETDPDLGNYIYKTENLSTLAGKHYAKKRNLIAQARKLYQWTIEPLTTANAEECLSVLGSLEASGDSADTLKKEDIAVRATIANLAALEQKGILIKVDGKAAAFSIYERINPDTAVIHFEKADRHYKGLYQIINQETAKAISADGYAFINREEDLGIEGLRQAKHSYGPDRIAIAHTLTFRPSK